MYKVIILRLDNNLFVCKFVFPKTFLQLMCLINVDPQILLHL